jgi:Methyltransferase domain
MAAEDRARTLARLAGEIAGLPPRWSVGGSLEAPVLAELARLAGQRRLRVSAETGAGASTLLLSHASDRHVVFSVGSEARLEPIRESPLLRRESVAFVEGPTQETLPRHRFDEPLQLVLLDGPHAYPFPDLEYYYFYPHIQAGGLLVLDDIHIPTLHNLFAFLREDEMFRQLGVVGKTAFFERTPAPSFPALGDDWERQAYNRRRFPVELVDFTGRLAAPARKALGRLRKVLGSGR